MNTSLRTRRIAADPVLTEIDAISQGLHDAADWLATDPPGDEVQLLANIGDHGREVGYDQSTFFLVPGADIPYFADYMLGDIPTDDDGRYRVRLHGWWRGVSTACELWHEG